MQVSLLTREFPPEVYGGAGVHVEYLARELRDLVDLTVHCFGADRAGREGVPAVGRGARQRGARDDVRRSRDDRRRRRRAARPLAHVVREPRRAPRRSSTTASRTSRRRTASSRCGRGRRSSSAAATTSRRSASAPRSRRRTRSSPCPARCATTCSSATRRSSPIACRSSTTASIRRSTRRTANTDVLERHGVDPATPYVIFVGRITHQKGLEHLLDAAPLLDPSRESRALRRRARHARDRRARPLAHPDSSSARSGSRRCCRSRR